MQLQFYAGGWDHRVRWGAEAHGPGRPNGGDHLAGDEPSLDECLRLEVDIADVGLEVGDVVDGWAFTQVGGTVYWDDAGVRTFGPPDDRHRYSLQAWEAIGAGASTTPAPVRAALAVAPSRARSITQQPNLGPEQEKRSR